MKCLKKCEYSNVPRETKGGDNMALVSQDLVQVKKYESQYEMMLDIAGMANNGWIIVYVFVANYTVKYTKSVPL